MNRHLYSRNVARRNNRRGPYKPLIGSDDKLTTHSRQRKPSGEEKKEPHISEISDFPDPETYKVWFSGEDGKLEQSVDCFPHNERPLPVSLEA